MAEKDTPLGVMTTWIIGRCRVWTALLGCYFWRESQSCHIPSVYPAIHRAHAFFFYLNNPRVVPPHLLPAKDEL